jgi:hypothetical protein
MAMRNLTVTFHTTVYSKKSEQSRKGFEFPKQLAKLLGWKKEERFTLALTITKPTGEVVFHDLAEFTSGTEIREVRIFGNLDYDDEIRVTACNAPTPQIKSK